MQEEKERGLHMEIAEEIGSLLGNPDKYTHLGPYSRDNNSVIFSSGSNPGSSLAISPATVAFKNGNSTLKFSLGMEEGIAVAYFLGAIKDETRSRVNEVMGVYAFGATRFYKEIPDSQAAIVKIYVGQHADNDEVSHDNYTMIGAPDGRPQLFHGNVAGRNVIAVSMPDGIGAFTNINVKTYEKKVFDLRTEIASFFKETPIRRFTSASFFSDEQLKSWTPSLEYNFRLPLGIGQNFVQTTLVEPFIKSQQT